MKAHAIYLDLADSYSFDTVVDFITSKFGRLDVLINNAAILIDMGKHPTDLSVELFRL